MYTLLPESPVRKIFNCPSCGNISLYFYDPKHNRCYTQDDAIEQEALKKALRVVSEDPKFFS